MAAATGDGGYSLLAVTGGVGDHAQFIQLQEVEAIACRSQGVGEAVAGFGKTEEVDLVLVELTVVSKAGLRDYVGRAVSAFSQGGVSRVVQERGVAD